MRRKHALVLLAFLAVGLAMPPVGRSQEHGLQPYYWPHRTVGIPVDVNLISKLPNKPTDLQLYYAVNGGSFQKGPKLPLNGMQSLDAGKKGFLFNAERDGEFDFAVQFVYQDNSTNPRTDELSAQQRIIVDTTAPQVKLYASGNGVEWTASDENLDPRGVTLQCKWPSSREWTTVNDRAFRTADRFAWRLEQGKVLEVRVSVRDRAGHESSSQVVRIPSDMASGVGFPKSGGTAIPGSGGAPNLPAPRIDYVNSLKFQVDYTVESMGRSGVKAAHLFVLRNQGDWERVKRFDDIRLLPGEKEQTLSLPFEAKEEGTYGFYVLAESGTGRKGDDPKKGDPAMIHVVVDTTAPYIQITGVQVRPGGTRGPIVDISWEAADPNLMPQPISLEWSLDSKAAKWNEVKYRLTNNLTQTTGRYSWEVPDDKMWKFYLRARAVDRASNTGEHIWGQDLPKKEKPPVEVLVDLETPTVGVKGARGGSVPPMTIPPSGGSDALPRLPGGSGAPSLPPLPGK